MPSIAIAPISNEEALRRKFRDNACKKSLEELNHMINNLIDKVLDPSVDDVDRSLYKLEAQTYAAMILRR